ncbi:hypothetical protein GCM10017600_40360 [Streptosporangium carneum]|uniref:Uncharacterized protein n=1 Tax=Streptosporangium carneum TaxID=47481 RepID=A0A9W6ME63_9ACTN|nr:hypothetical protein GCM10017600_40360 [Streptosporangium carneum]
MRSGPALNDAGPGPVARRHTRPAVGRQDAFLSALIHLGFAWLNLMADAVGCGHRVIFGVFTNFA